MGQELDLNFVLGSNLDEAMPMLRRLKQPVVIDANLEYFETDAETREEEQFCSAKMLAEAGVPFALSLSSSGPSSNPWWQLGTCVRNGVSRQQAIEAMTTIPAKMIGMEDQVGSLSEGKLGNLQILTGDPLSATTWVEMVLLEGEVVYERSEDPRLQYLFEAADETAEPQEPNKEGDK